MIGTVAWMKDFFTGLLSIDLKNAFDSVDHEILCQKLEYYGVVGKELSWFKSYLTTESNIVELMVWIQT